MHKHLLELALLALAVQGKRLLKDSGSLQSDSDAKVSGPKVHALMPILLAFHLSPSNAFAVNGAPRGGASGVSTVNSGPMMSRFAAPVMEIKKGSRVRVLSKGYWQGEFGTVILFRELPGVTAVVVLFNQLADWESSHGTFSMEELEETKASPPKAKKASPPQAKKASPPKAKNAEPSRTRPGQTITVPRKLLEDLLGKAGYSYEDGQLLAAEAAKEAAALTEAATNFRWGGGIPPARRAGDMAAEEVEPAEEATEKSEGEADQ